MSRLEHVNVTVTDPAATAAWLDKVFGWEVRWKGGSIHGGTSWHVGGTDDYVALYAPPKPTGAPPESYFVHGGLNHVGVVVEDLDAVEGRVKDAGFTPFNHADYEPGRRFYFRDGDGIEWEVVSYG
jgi:catechol 2,3-dioxygenase-like lactoylglutathione lyase family enzyme